MVYQNYITPAMTTRHDMIPFEAYKGDKPYIFVSYAHLDSDSVFKEIRRLYVAGYRIWYDEGISPTHEWSEDIAVALEKSVIFVYFVSPRSVNSKNCRDEAYFALDNEKPFLAIYIDKTEVPMGLKLRMNRIQSIIRHQLPVNIYEKRLERTLEPFNVREALSHAEGGINPAPHFLLSELEQQSLSPLTLKYIGIGVGALAVIFLVIWIMFLPPINNGNNSPAVNNTKSSNHTLALSNVTVSNSSTDKANTTVLNNITVPDSSTNTTDTTTPSNISASNASTETVPVSPVGILGADDAIKASQLSMNSLKSASNAVGRILLLTKEGQNFSCTGFLIGTDLVATAATCVQDIESAKLIMGDKGEQTPYNITVPPVELVSNPDGLEYALLRVSGNPGLKYGKLRLASTAPTVDQSLSMVMFRGTDEKLVVSGAADCKVISVEDSVFNHRCDSGPGSTGAPILTPDGSKVLGIHFKRDGQGGLASRADKILSRSKVFQ